MRLPDFLIIGAAKSGTTTLYQYLSQHPSVFMPMEKEPDFFGSQYDRGAQWYSSLFHGAGEDQICGEASTDYTKFPNFPDCPERIARIIPTVKLIYIMRNPVDRTFSHYRHLNREKEFLPTFDDFLEQRPDIIDASRYMLQIQRYLDHFPRTSFLFLLLENYRQDPDSFLAEVGSFLGIQETSFPATPIVANTSNRFREHIVRSAVVAPLKRVPLVRKIAASLPDSWREAAYHALANSSYGQRVREAYAVAPMRQETRQHLVELFRPDNAKLAHFLGRDLSSWNVV